jgi:hypothetical protein
MTEKHDGPPLRGDDAYRAQKKAIAERNEAAYARGREQRAVRDREAAVRRHEQERRESANTPAQPGGH